jgi:hypothetical protein
MHLMLRQTEVHRHQPGGRSNESLQLWGLLARPVGVRTLLTQLAQTAPVLSEPDENNDMKLETAKFAMVMFGKRTVGKGAIFAM